jgi:Protein of unknown function (DUF4013)
MKYMESYRFLFRSPNWITNLLLCTVAQFVPVIGPMVFLGYQFEIIEILHRRGDGDYPDVDLDRLNRYLGRGAWVFLVHLVVYLPMIPLFMFLYFGFWIGMAMAASPRGNPAMIIPVLIFCFCGFAFLMLLEFALNVILMPMTLRAGLLSDFNSAFSWTFIRDFLSRMWLRTLLAELFLFVTGIPLAFAGMALFFIGLYPAATLMLFARTYLLYELYEEYLRRGGMEIQRPAEHMPYPDRDERIRE